VTGPRDDRDAPLKAAFRDLAASADEACTEEEIDRIWRAAAGELDADDRRVLVDRMAANPAAAEAWRVAQVMREVQGYGAPASTPARHSWSPAWIGLAAALTLAVGLGLFQVNRSSAPSADVYRDASVSSTESLVPPDTVLARDAFVLKWSPGPAGSRYLVRVTTDDLRVLTTVADVKAPELTIPMAALDSVAAGSRVLWQVVTTLPSGQTVSSRTFVVRVP
jgi:hypothetical protein